jgi:thiamine pyrophosphate-dependent acetolactate synthase large subunit-like protein
LSPETGDHLVNIGQAIVECCRVEGVRHIFGLIGSSHLEIVDSIARTNDIQFVGVRHEQAAAFMADAYARATGGIGVVLTSSGPGVSNTITGIALAKRAYSPVISLGGATKTAFEQMGAKQEIDQLSLMRPVTKEVLRINRADRAADIMRQAFRIALSGQRGPVHVDIPRDLLPAKLEFEFPAPASYRSSSRQAPANEEIVRALDLIEKAERPLILAGGGVKWSGATRQLIEFAERFNLPVVTSDGHRDVMPNDHPLFFGQLGPRGSASAKELGLKADLIFALGTRLGFTTTLFNNSFISKGVAIIQSDIEPSEIGRTFPIALGIVGDAGAVAAACVFESRKREGLKQLKEWRAFADERRAAWLRARDQSADQSVPIRTGRAFTELRRAAPRNMLVTVDAGHWGAIATDAFDHYECPTLFTPLDYGSLGFSFPAALGLKCARPEAPVLSINGDGGFAMNMQEIETAVRMRLNPVVMVFNNFAWGTEKAHQRDSFGGNYLGVELGNPRFDQLAQLFGARGLRVEKPGDLAEAVASSFKQDLPTIIDVIVDPDDLEILT